MYGQLHKRHVSNEGNWIVQNLKGNPPRVPSKNIIMLFHNLTTVTWCLKIVIRNA